MSESAENKDTAELARVIDAWQPRSRDEESKRAYFFLHMLGAHCLTRLEEILASSHDVYSKPDVLQAVKFLVCVSSYLAVLESSDGKPFSWLMEWLLQVLVQSDEFLPDPPARGVTEQLGELNTSGIIELATQSASLQLNLHETDQRLLIAMLTEDRPYRNELLLMSLTHSVRALRDHIMLFG